MDKKLTPDAVYSSYEEMDKAETSGPICVSAATPADMSRVIQVTEELPTEYNVSEEFDAELSPHLQAIRSFCQKHSVPFLFVASPSCTKEEEADEDGEHAMKSANICIGYLPGKRTPAAYRFAADAIKDFEGSAQKLTNKALAFGRASGAVELEDALEKIDEKKFDKDTVISVARAVAAKFMLTSMALDKDPDLGKIRDMVQSLIDDVKEDKAEEKSEEAE